MRVRADQEDVEVGRAAAAARKRGVDAEGHELDARGDAPSRSHRSSASASRSAEGEDRRRRAERARVETPHPLERSLASRSGNPIDDVDERRPDAAGPLEQDEGNADGVDRGEDGVGAVRTRRDRGPRRSPPVAARPLERPVEDRAAAPRPSRGPPPLEVVAYPSPPLRELIETKEKSSAPGPGGDRERPRRCGESR